MKDKNWFFGVLVEQGRLKTNTGELLLTKLPKDATESTDSGVLVVAEEDLGKTVLVRGDLVAGVLYSVELVETLPRLTGALVQKLETKDLCTFIKNTSYCC